jgi:type VI secretion system secreted protein VgrG
LDVQAAITWIDARARTNSTGRCAYFVRQAILAGGIEIKPWPLSAKDYIDYLPSYGFSVVSTSPSFDPTAGDVVVVQNYEGGSIHGHIAMFTGSQWLSDFRQRDIWPGPGYRKAQPPLAIYRA